MLSAEDVPGLFRAGDSVRDIAALVGLCERRVRQIVAQAGLRPVAKPVPSTRLTCIGLS